MIDTVIFSKDRAAQCELLLRSIRDNAPYITNPTVLYKADNDWFDVGYMKVKEMHSEVNFVKETNFTNDVRTIISKFQSKFCMFLVDDSVFINNLDVATGLNILLESSVHCISLRLNPQVDYCYMLNSTWKNDYLLPHMYCGLPMYRWNWKQVESKSDWGYPSCIDSHIYHTGFINFIFNNDGVNTLKINNPNVMEIVLDNIKSIFKPEMICLEKTSILTIPNNKVQEICPNNRANGEIKNSIAHLNDLFLGGWKIDTSNIYGVETNSVHMEIPYIWEKR